MYCLLPTLNEDKREKASAVEEFNIKLEEMKPLSYMGVVVAVGCRPSE